MGRGHVPGGDVMPKHTGTVGYNRAQYLRAIKSQHHRTAVVHAYRDLASSRNGGAPRPGWTDWHREILQDAILRVENDLESRKGGQPDHPTVVQMRGVRNRIMDELGWNDSQEAA